MYSFPSCQMTSKNSKFSKTKGRVLTRKQWCTILQEELFEIPNSAFAKLL